MINGDQHYQTQKCSSKAGLRANTLIMNTGGTFGFYVSPKKRSRKAASLSRTVCFLSACALPAENRDVGGRILVIAVPVDGIAPSRKALSTNALAATPGREVVSCGCPPWCRGG